MPLKWNSKIFLAKIESTYGVDPTPTGAANAILATDVNLSPMEGEDVSRELETPHLGGQGTIPTGLHSKLSFKVELAGSGAAGTVPAWGPLLRMCGVAETISAGVSVTYNPVTDNHESGAVYLWIGATQFVILGSRGTCVLRFDAQAIPYLEFELTGLFKQPTEVTRVTPTLTAFKKPLVVTKANTPTFAIDSTNMVMRSLSLNLGNQVENRFLVGSEGVLITEKEEMLDTTVEAVDLGTFNPFTLAANSTDIDVDLVHGTAAGNIATLDVPKAQLQRLQGLENAQDILEWPLKIMPLPNAGNDQWTLVLT